MYCEVLATNPGNSTVISQRIWILGIRVRHPVLPTGEKGDKSSALQFEDQCTLDTIMADRYSPTASGNSRSQPTSGNGVDETPTVYRPNGSNKARHTIGNPLDQAESTPKASGGVNF